MVCSMLFSGCLNPCDDELKSELASPDGKYIAGVFVRGCGATTSNFTHVMLRSQRFFSSYRDDNIVFTVKYDPEVKLHWKDLTHLMIRYPADVKSADLFPPRDWQNVRITVVPDSP
jgi:hypothetical protein